MVASFRATSSTLHFSVLWATNSCRNPSIVKAPDLKPAKVVEDSKSSFLDRACNSDRTADLETRYNRLYALTFMCLSQH